MENSLKETLSEDGFVAAPGIFGIDDLLEVQRILDPLFSTQERHVVSLGAFGSNDTIELRGTEKYDRRLVKSSIVVKCADLARSIFEDTPIFAGSHAIYKRPYGKCATAWHQDEIYDRRWLRHPGITMWIPLQSVEATTGCMRFVRGSHLTGVRPHHHRDGDARNHAQEVRDFDKAAIVDCPLEAGGLTIHMPRTIHAAGVNAGGETRRAWILSFAPRSGYHWKRAINYGVRCLG